MRRLVAAVSISLALGKTAVAAPTFGDEAFVEAVGSLIVTETLAADCPQSRQAPLSQRLAAWERANRVESLRAAIAEARRQPGGEQRYQTMEKAVPGFATSLYGKGCAGLATWLDRPEASLAGKFDGTTPPARAAGAARVAATAPPAARPAASTAGPPTSAGIHGYGLVQSYGVGYGGSITVRIRPAVLYKSGDILLDMEGVAAPGGPASDRARNPQRWSQWRQAGGGYQYRTKKGEWQSIYNNKVWSTAPTAQLSGRYVNTGGTGNTALGGGAAVFAEAAYTFEPGGRVTRDQFAGSTSPTTTALGRASPRSGRYSVSGLTLTIAYDDGGREQALFMTHPSDPNIVWVNGLEYIRRRR